MTARVITGQEAETIRDARTIRATRRERTGLMQALLDGQMVHFDDTRSHFNSVALRRRHQLRLHTALDGTGGRYWWAEGETS